MTPVQTLLRSSLFTLDVFDTPPAAPCFFAGLTLGERWNGWACPYFTLKQAQLLANGWNALGADAYYNAVSDEFVFTSLDQSEEGDEHYGSVMIENRRLYPIGTRAWTWDEVSSETSEA